MGGDVCSWVQSGLKLRSALITEALRASCLTLEMRRGGMEFTFFWLELPRITSNYLELVRIVVSAIMNKIGRMSMSMGEGGYPWK
jgi:hypothetical protein